MGPPGSAIITEEIPWARITRAASEIDAAESTMTTFRFIRSRTRMHNSRPGAMGSGPAPIPPIFPVWASRSVVRFHLAPPIIPIGSSEGAGPVGRLQMRATSEVGYDLRGKALHLRRVIVERIEHDHFGACSHDVA